MSFLVWQSSCWGNHLAGTKRAGCFTLTVSLQLCGCLFSVSLSRVAVSLSCIYDSGISWSYSLVFTRFVCRYKHRSMRIVINCFILELSVCVLHAYLLCKLYAFTYLIAFKEISSPLWRRLWQNVVFISHKIYEIATAT